MASSTPPTVSALPHAGTTLARARMAAARIAHTIQGDDTATADHPGGEAKPLALLRHLQLSQPQLLAHQPGDLLGKLLGQVTDRAILIRGRPELPARAGQSGRPSFVICVQRRGDCGALAVLRGLCVSLAVGSGDGHNGGLPGAP